MKRRKKFDEWIKSHYLDFFISDPNMRKAWRRQVKNNPDGTARQSVFFK